MKTETEKTPRSTAAPCRDVFGHWRNLRSIDLATIRRVLGKEIAELLVCVSAQPPRTITRIGYENWLAGLKMKSDAIGEFLTINLVVNAYGEKLLSEPKVIGELLFHRVGKTGGVNEVNHAQKIAKKGRK